MKRAFKNSSEVAHVWAQQNQSEGWFNTHGRKQIFFRDSRIYSYGHHFCIARILPSGVAVLSTQSWSVTTSKHQSEVRHAVSHRRKVYCYDCDRTAEHNREYTERRIKDNLEEAATKRRVLPKTRIENRLEALRLAEQFNEYLDALPPTERTVYQVRVEPFDLKPLEVSEEDRLFLREYQQKVDDRRHLKWEKDAEKRKVMAAKMALTEKERIAEWRANIYNHNLYNVPTMLRLSKDRQNVETSKGAEIPVSHAKRLWPIIENVRAVGKAYEGRPIHLGHYTLERIGVDGSIVVGCHNIAYGEIANIARELGLIEELTS